MKELSKYAAKKARQAETGEVGYMTVPVEVTVKVEAAVPSVTKSEAQSRTRSDIEPLMRELAGLANEATSKLNELHLKLRANYTVEPDGPFKKILSNWIDKTGQCINRTSSIRNGTRQVRRAFSGRRVVA